MEFNSEEDRGTVVSRDDSEALLAMVARGTADANAGIFGPNSVSWKINRESALFLGAGRAALLQLAHPWVATALLEHSSLMAKPIARFHNTFRIVFTMLFGSLDQAVAVGRHLYALHTRVRGEMPEEIAAYRRGSAYEANEIAALRWVYATLVESAVIAYECVMPPLRAAELGAYYSESKTLAALFGLPSSALPEDWDAFLGYCREMENSTALGVSEKSRSMARRLLAGGGSWVHPPKWYCALTTEWMPKRFRDGFALSFGESEQRAAERARRWLPRIYRTLPATIRFVGPWHEATLRLDGRKASVLTKASNRFWIGQARLPFGGDLKNKSQA